MNHLSGGTGPGLARVFPVFRSRVFGSRTAFPFAPPLYRRDLNANVAGELACKSTHSSNRKAITRAMRFHSPAGRRPEAALVRTASQETGPTGNGTPGSSGSVCSGIFSTNFLYRFKYFNPCDTSALTFPRTIGTKPVTRSLPTSIA